MASFSLSLCLSLIFLIMIVPGVSYIYGENSCISESVIESQTRSNLFEFQTTFEGIDDSNAKMQITLQGNIEKTPPSASLSTEKIIIYRYIGSENPETSFVVSMSDGSVPLIKGITLSEFFIADKTTSSVAHDQKSLVFQQNFVKHNQNCIITLIDNSEIETLGKYVGKLSILGDNFDTKTIDVEYKVQWHPGLLVFFTIIGVVISMVSGFALLKAENTKSTYIKRKAKMAILKHINAHISFFNTQSISGGILDGIRAFHKSKLFFLQNNSLPNSNTIDLEKVPMTVLEDLLKQYHRKFEEWYENVTDDPSCPKPELDLFEYDQSIIVPKVTLKQTNNKSEISISDLVKHKETITAFSTVIATIISVPATLFAVTYFSGIPIIDAFIAGGIGFTVYRFKDIGKMLKGLV